MAKVKPFRAVRPERALSSLVATRTYISYTESSIEEKLAGNPFSFLHVLHPDRKYGLELEGVEKYPLVKNRYSDFKDDNIFIKDETEKYYIYRQKHEGISFTGIISAINVDDYIDGTIKLHEETISRREEIFTEYLDVTGFNSEPVLVTYKDNTAINDIITKYTADRSEYEFATTNRDIHYLWLVDNKYDIDEITKQFEGVKNIYIADGHHRSASSVNLAKRKNEEGNTNNSFNYFMTYMIAESQLKIYSFNRLVKDLNGFTKDQFLMELDTYYRIKNLGQIYYRPSHKHHFSMYLDGEYYSLYLRKQHFDIDNPLEDLDSQLIYETVLNPILNIKDMRNDKRLSFQSEKKGFAAMKDRVDSGEYEVAFGLVPVSISQLKKIADSDYNMPPKSTYIEPKLRSGLTIYEYE
ncbi:MAG: DUF1015 domain-containing protein [Flavobacteriales bacterium]|nr:DUF1015 domain-containing protein [Flavobacteriales bacterium]